MQASNYALSENNIVITKQIHFNSNILIPCLFNLKVLYCDCLLFIMFIYLFNDIFKDTCKLALCLSIFKVTLRIWAMSNCIWILYRKNPKCSNSGPVLNGIWSSVQMPFDCRNKIQWQSHSKARQVSPLFRCFWYSGVRYSEPTFIVTWLPSIL